MSFTKILQNHGIPYKLYGSHEHVTKGWIGFDCPFCSPNTERFLMGYNLVKHYTNCWRCGYHPAYRSLSQLLGIPTAEAWRILGQSDPGWEFEGRSKPHGELKIPNGLGALQSIHINYLESRGFDVKELTRLWGIQGIGLAKELAWRIWIPIHHNGIVVSWTTRSTCDSGTRYINAKKEQESLPAKSLLYGEDLTRHSAIVCEGPTDVWRIGPGAVATMGVAISSAQVKRISEYPERIICFDNEPIAQQRALSLCQQLIKFPGQTHNVVLDAKDPGSANLQEINSIRRRFLE